MDKRKLILDWMGTDGVSIDTYYIGKVNNTRDKLIFYFYGGGIFMGWA